MLENPINSPESNRQCNENAFTAFYAAYGCVLFGVIGQILKNQQDAQEALQKTLIKIWTNSNSYKEENGRALTWMANIACNEAIDLLQVKQKTSAAFSALPEKETHNSNHWLPGMGIKEVRRLSAQLPPMDRCIIELVLVRGYTCEQTAKLLKLSCSTVKAQLQTGYRKLRTAIN